MIHFLQKIALIILCQILCSNVYALARVDNDFTMRQIEGIPQSEINALYEDQRGFVWIATLDGLYRYDGHNFKPYMVGGDENTTGSNMILTINEDRHGNIWVGTYGCGLCMIDSQTDKITNYPLDILTGSDVSSNDVLTIEIDRDDNVWIGNWYSVIKIEFEDGCFDIRSVKVYPIDEQSKVDRDCINKIHEDKLGNIWIGRNLSLRRVIGEMDGELLYDTYDVPAQDIEDYGDNSIVVVSGDIIILSKDPHSDRFNKSYIETLKSDASKVALFSQSQLWIGGRKDVVSLDLSDSGTWVEKNIYCKEDMPDAITPSMVSDILVTSNNQIWIGTRGGGVFTINKTLKQFNNYLYQDNAKVQPNFIVKALFEDLDGNLWIGSEEKGVLFQSKKDRYGYNIRKLEVNKFDDRAYAFEQSSKDIVWVGTCHDVNIVAFNTKTLKPIEQVFDVSEIGFVFALKLSDSNTMWVGTYNHGLWRLKIDDNGHIVGGKNFMVGTSSICSNIIRSLFISESGDLWIGTDVGVNRIAREDLNSETPRFLKTLNRRSQHNLDRTYVLQIAEIASGDMLFGTMGNGLVCYDHKQDSLRYITTNEGLSNNSVKSIVENPNNGDVWLSTNRGLSKYNTITNEIVNYDKDDGIFECEFSEICGLMRANGDLVFGSRDGIVVFNPTEITPSGITPNLYFTNLYINHKIVNTGVEYGGRVILDKTPERTSSIELEYDERNFSLAFIGLNHFSPQGDKYRYKLEGIDPDWIEVYDGNPMAIYTNIHEGDYIFRAKAANADGVWSEKELRLNIVVKPPLHRSTLAYAIYVLLLLLIVYLIYWIVSLVINKRREAYEAQMEQHKAEDLIQYKLEFFMNISHEFRTPVTLINIMLEKLLSIVKREENREMSESLYEIKHNVNMLHSLINQLLDFRKIERGKQNINPTPTDIAKYITTYFDHFRPLAEKNNISYTYNVNDDVIIAPIDIKLFEKVVTNILSNAFKYTPVGGTITLSVSKDEKRGVVIFSSKDSGRGVSRNEIPHLFDRFYQGANKNSTSNGSSGGSGIGLSLCKGIVELHMGQILIISDINQGFECIVELPMSPDQTDIEVSDLPVVSHECSTIVDDMMYNSAQTLDVKLKGGKREMLLIVEDNEQLRLQLTKELIEEYDIISACDGVEGLEMCINRHPALIITDVMMPRMDGIEMCRQIKSCEEVSHTPIMVLTADNSIKNQIDSFTIGGADGYLDKPFSMIVLKCKIETILNNRRILKRRFNQETIVNPESIARTPADLKCISQIIAIIKKNMSNSELSIEQIAQEYGVSRTYLNRKIKALTGETSAQFLRNIRLKYAAKLILQKSMNISEVAWSVGYNDVKTFRGRFKEMFGVAPTNYKGEPAIADESTIDDETLM